MEKEKVKQQIADALGQVVRIERTTEPTELSDRGERDLRDTFFGDEEINGVTVTYQSENTGESLAYMTIYYTDTLAYLGFINVSSSLQNKGIATVMLREDLIPYCRDELGVSTICGSAKAEEMKTVFGKAEFSEEDVEGTYYYYLD
jgi:predicted GNAT family acetyltransferase